MADKESGKIYGATDSSDIGKKLDDIGITKKGDEEGKIFTGINEIDGENYRCSFYITGDYAVGVACSNSSNVTPGSGIKRAGTIIVSTSMESGS